MSDSVLLVSCLGENTGGGLFVVDGERVERLDRLSTTGVAVSENGSIARVLHSPDAGSPVEVLVYDRIGVKSYARVDAAADPHDIVWDGDALVIVSTGTNSLVWITPGGAVTHEWRAAGVGDAWHLNSIVRRDDGRFAVCAFGRFETNREWALNPPAARGLVFDLSTGDDLVKSLGFPHHPRFVDDRWVVCNSLSSEIVQVREGDCRVERRLRLAGWTRGLAVGRTVLYVGESAHRLSAGPKARASVAVVDRERWTVLARIPLPCEEIYDLIILPRSAVDALRRGFRTSPTRTAEQNQFELFRQVGVEPPLLWAVGEPLERDDCRISVLAEVPASLPGSTVTHVNCRLANRGRAPLVSVPPYPTQISYRWYRLSGEALGGDSLRTKLPRALRPGESASCRLAVHTPGEQGRFLLRITLVQEHVAWFDDLDERNAFSAEVDVVLT